MTAVRLIVCDALSSSLDPSPVSPASVPVLPPSLMVPALVAGRIDGFCAGEPWGSLAVEEKAGRIVTTKAHVWRSSPEKVLAVREEWAEAERAAAAEQAAAEQAASEQAHAQQDAEAEQAAGGHDSGEQAADRGEDASERHDVPETDEATTGRAVAEPRHADVDTHQADDPDRT